MKSMGNPLIDFLRKHNQNTKMGAEIINVYIEKILIKQKNKNTKDISKVNSMKSKNTFRIKSSNRSWSVFLLVFPIIRNTYCKYTYMEIALSIY